ncbi:TetR/AcrR family transcriptional regulator [Ilumatobacter sp.]|uniref:TetR/AcrR family transcriptional regulator n=1 Tax=Ilumatobacter sp. TaxID=1967498 RepID=UPI003753C892
MLAPPSRRDQILNAARDAFTTAGYDGTAVGDIARNLGISKAAITYHFPAKADLITALLDPLIDQLQTVLAQRPEPAWPTEVRQLLHNYFVVLIESIDLARWADTDPALRADNRPGTTLRRFDQQLAQRIADPDPTRQDHMRALAAIGGIWRPLHHEPALQLLEHIDEIINAALVSYAPLDAQLPT